MIQSKNTPIDISKIAPLLKEITGILKEGDIEAQDCVKSIDDQISKLNNNHALSIVKEMAKSFKKTL